MTFDKLQRILVWLLITVAVIYLAEKLLFVFSFLATPLLLFALAWLFALALRPLVDGMTRLEIPVPLVQFNRSPSENRIVMPVIHVPRAAAVTLVYLAMFAVLVALVVLFVPVILPQIATLQETLPQAGNEIVLWLDGTQQYLNQLGLGVDFASIFAPEALSSQITSVGSEVVKQSFNIAGGIASLLFNLVFILILSFYMTLDGPRLTRQSLSVLPEEWRGEVATLMEIVDRTFGGFLRAQLVQSLLYGVATAALMVALGLTEVALASLIAGLMVLIPIIGGFLAMVPPLIIALIQEPDRIFWVFVGLVIVQQIIFNVIMPRLLGQIVGLHPLLVFAALLIGGTFAGAWGIVFGIPLAGVISSVLQFLYVRSVSQHAPKPVEPAGERTR
jgi:predicted PurR-regulated permease PerM